MLEYASAPGHWSSGFAPLTPLLCLISLVSRGASRSKRERMRGEERWGEDRRGKVKKGVMGRIKEKKILQEKIIAL